MDKNTPFHIRHAQLSDLDTIVELLNPYILNTATTFDTEAYTTQTRQPWFDNFSEQGRYQCLVAEYDGTVIGYANSSQLKPKNAYDTSIEVSVYRNTDIPIPGVGSALYRELFNTLSARQIHRAYAYITLPNAPSIGLHKKFGFTDVGTLSDAGWKLGKFHSVLLMEKCFGSMSEEAV